ncbi:MAG: copper ion binding protein [Bacillota bacterium]
MASEIIRVEGMTCNHCKMSVEKAVKNLEGVQNAEVDLAAKQVKATFDEKKVDAQRIRDAIVQAGYEVV